MKSERPELGPSGRGLKAVEYVRRAPLFKDDVSPLLQRPAAATVSRAAAPEFNQAVKYVRTLSVFKGESGTQSAAQQSSAVKYVRSAPLFKGDASTQSAAQQPFAQQSLQRPATATRTQSAAQQPLSLTVKSAVAAVTEAVDGARLQQLPFDEMKERLRRRLALSV